MAAPPIITADFTAGLHAAGGLMLILQLQTARGASAPAPAPARTTERTVARTTARIVTSAMLEVSEGLHVRLSASAGVLNDRAAGMTLGTWLEF
jgi:hypothetical protein